MPKFQHAPEAVWTIIAIRQGFVWPLLDKADALLQYTWEAGAAVRRRTLCRASKNLLANLDTGETRWK